LDLLRFHVAIRFGLEVQARLPHIRRNLGVGGRAKSAADPGRLRGTKGDWSPVAPQWMQRPFVLGATQGGFKIVA
jgi:hypothetical protein